MGNEAEFEQLIGESIRGAFVIRGDRGVKFNQLTDGLHPDSDGYARIAANFIARRPRTWLA